MRLKYSCSDLFTIKIQTVKNYIYSRKKFNVKLKPDVSCTTLRLGRVFDSHTRGSSSTDSNCARLLCLIVVRVENPNSHK